MPCARRAIRRARSRRLSIRALIAAGCAIVLCAFTAAPAFAQGQPRAADPLTEGQAFLAKNAAVEGVKTLPSGVQYKTVREGPENGQPPSPDDDILIHYEGRFLNGTVFDSSYARGEQRRAPLSALIPGWQEALQIMTPGDLWEVYIPPQMAYGSRDRGPVPGNSVLIFKIELFGAYPPEGDNGEEFH